ncbi:LysR family transcriptional regulator [Phenylobacterium sp. Root700]|uniref:LysR family transcriptional regulator n=1 Tax=Phenylobacterium sp. Root700 TaxID=1736591 RepID=UPI0006F43001|nr:LysR family transcriptional regulator [Phenylobacterium sp. Root700]KRB42533.1 LysR family transcriptional regulator [Phenylobacterium sp. Root700]
MPDTHFRNLDLNLLRVFVALLEEESATRAGARLGLTQSAVSHALGRLRASLGDELFLRGPTGLRATPRAAEMGPAIRAALKLLESAVTTPRFDPATTQRTFHISASAYACSVLMPGVVQRLLSEAPGVKLRMRGPDASLVDDLDRGRLDMVIGGFDYVAARFAYAPLFMETGVWVIRADHPAANGELDDAVLARLPRLIVASGDAAMEGAARMGGRDLGLRTITSWGDDYDLGGVSLRDFQGPVTVPDAYSALIIVGQTDMAALLPRRLAMLAQQRGRLVLIEPSREPEPASFGAVIRAGESQPVNWLLGIVRDEAAKL